MTQRNAWFAEFWIFPKETQTKTEQTPQLSPARHRAATVVVITIIMEVCSRRGGEHWAELPWAEGGSWAELPWAEGGSWAELPWAEGGSWAELPWAEGGGNRAW
eukprot:gene13868-59080_t